MTGGIREVSVEKKEGKREGATAGRGRLEGM